MKVKCARCSDNQDIYDRIQKLKTISDIRRNQNASFSYAQILKTLEKYPVPIISVKQALGLEGVGIKTASLINEVLNTKYETYKQARPVVAEDNSRSNSLTRLAFPEDQTRSPLPRTDFCLESLGVKRINTAVSFELNDDKSKKPAKPGKAAKITEKSTILLTTIYMRQTESQFRKYFTKDEIHAFLTKNPLVEPNTKLKQHYNQNETNTKTKQKPELKQNYNHTKTELRANANHTKTRTRTASKTTLKQR